MNTKEFLANIGFIEDSNPKYKLGHSGDDGYCDCIGLVIGALERGGIDWPGIHGSNWAIRNVMADVRSIVGTPDLEPGMLVYKAKEPGTSGYDLPARYDDHPDQRDYYHVGIVRSAYPLRIVHCTSPGGIKEDTSLKPWGYAGRLTLLDYESNDEPVATAAIEGRAKVVAQSGNTVNMRSRPNRGADVMTRVPVGAEVEVVSVDGEWARIRYPMEGYMMASFLKGGD